MVRSTANRAAATVLAFLLPPAVMVVAILILRLIPGGHLLFARLLEVPVLGNAVLWVLAGVASVYFPPFLVTGSPDPVLAGFGLFLVSAAVLALRRQYVAASLVVLLPLALTWWFAWGFMGD